MNDRLWVRADFIWKIEIVFVACLCDGRCEWVQMLEKDFFKCWKVFKLFPFSSCSGSYVRSTVWVIIKIASHLKRKRKRVSLPVGMRKCMWIFYRATIEEAFGRLEFVFLIFSSGFGGMSPPLIVGLIPSLHATVFVEIHSYRGNWFNKYETHRRKHLSDASKTFINQKRFA